MQRKLNRGSRLAAMRRRAASPGSGVRARPLVVAALAVIVGALAALSGGTPPAHAQPFVFVVNSNDDVDDGQCNSTHCSLREAIYWSNWAAPSEDRIEFNIGAGGPQTITPTSALPTITDPVTIDGDTQPGCTSYPCIELNGTAAGTGVNGLRIATDGCSSLSYLVVNRFDGHGVLVEGCADILWSFIGTDSTGTLDRGNSGHGVYITGDGYSQLYDNVISGNDGSGVVIAGGLNTWLGRNHIGTDASGTAPLGNSSYGVYISGVAYSKIGEYGGNVISGNGDSGIRISGSGAFLNQVRGNFIGTDVTGTVALGNSGDGIEIAGAHDNYIGVSFSGLHDPNIISGNRDFGIAMSGSPTTGNVVQANFIGTDVSGTLVLGNGDNGVLIYSAPGNTVGGTEAGAGNVISGNGTTGVRISQSGATGNQVLGNFIGTDETATLVLGNVDSGVLVSSAPGNTIGGTEAGAANIIAHNGLDGVNVTGAGATGNTISGNSVYSNGGKGIENDAGGNTELAPPIVDATGSASGHTYPKCYPCTVEVFSDDEDEGRIYHGSTTTNDDAMGTWFYLGAVTGPNVTATVSDASGNTSEFSEPFAHTPSQVPHFSISSESTSAVPGVPGGAFSPSDLLVVPGLDAFLACPSLYLEYCYMEEGDNDDVDALSYGTDLTLPPPDPSEPLYFSVDASSSGNLGSAVRQEAECGEAEADEFGTNGFGTTYDSGHKGNYHYRDGDGVACNGAPLAPAFELVEPGDDVDALADSETYSGLVYYSLDAESPSLAWMGSAADIFVAGEGAEVYASWSQLGLQESDDIDALCILEDSISGYQAGSDRVLFSLARLSPTLPANSWSAADILEAQASGPPKLLMTADQLGLLPSDNLDAMKCYHGREPELKQKFVELRLQRYAPKTLVAISDHGLGALPDMRVIFEILGGNLRTGRIALRDVGSWSEELDPGTPVGAAWTEVNVGGVRLTVAKAGLTQLTKPITKDQMVPIRVADRMAIPEEALARAGVERARIRAAFKAVGSEAGIYDSDGNPIDIPFDIGIGYAAIDDITLVNPMPTPKPQPILFSGGSTPLPSCVQAVGGELYLDGEVTGGGGAGGVSPLGTTGPVRENPALCNADVNADTIDDCAGYYPVAKRAVSQEDPFAGGHYGTIGFECFFLGGTPLDGSDDDRDCLEDVSTAQPQRLADGAVEGPTDDTDPDSDGDGLVDGLEVLFGSDPWAADSDSDGLDDYEEALLRTIPNPDNDSDDDGIGDWVDRCPTEPDPSQEDTDGDGQGDACDLDDDNDGLFDMQELTVGIVKITDPGKETWRCDFGATTFGLPPTNPDYDGDGYLDGAECLLGSDPTDIDSVPEICANSLDDDKDGLYDELATNLGLEFVDGACAPPPPGPEPPRSPDGPFWDPDEDGLRETVDGKISEEIQALTMCVPNPMTADDPDEAQFPNCDDVDPTGQPYYLNDVDGDTVIGRLDWDSDNDLVSDGVEFLELGTSPVNPDTDGDGCAEWEELPGATEPAPGATAVDTDGDTVPDLGYKPNAWYDFYDVPVPAMADPTPNGARNQAVAMDDVLAVLCYVGTQSVLPPEGVDPCGDNPNANGVDYDCDKDDDGRPDGEDYDRSPGGADWNPPWDAGPPSLAVAMDDVLVVLAQVGLSCIGAP